VSEDAEHVPEELARSGAASSDLSTIIKHLLDLKQAAARPAGAAVHPHDIQVG
jgi:hypothetical protein